MELQWQTNQKATSSPQRILNNFPLRVLLAFIFGIHFKG